MQTAIDVLTWICIVGGSLFAIIGGIGLLRLPDVYSRMHGGGITDTAGAWLILLGLMLQSGLSLATIKLVTVLLLLGLTSPVSTHAVARAARLRGIEPFTGRREDRPSST